MSQRIFLFIIVYQTNILSKVFWTTLQMTFFIEKKERIRQSFHFSLFTNPCLLLRLALASTGRKRRAAMEDATDQIVKGNITVDTLAALEPEDCFQRLFCSAATRRYRLP